MFSQSFLHVLILLALAWTSLGTLVLLALFLCDWKRGKLW